MRQAADEKLSSVSFPQVATANKLAQQLTRLEQEFGMTPSARTRIQIVPPASTDPRVAKHFGPPTDKSRFFGRHEKNRVPLTRPAGRDNRIGNAARLKMKTVFHAIPIKDFSTPILLPSWCDHALAEKRVRPKRRS